MTTPEENIPTSLNPDERMLINSIRRKRRMADLMVPDFILKKEAKMIAERMRKLVGEGWEETALAAYQSDVQRAAEACEISLPEPGSEMARLLQANQLLHTQLDNIISSVNYQLQPDEDGPDPFATPTIYERLCDDLFCERARRYILGIS